MDDITVGVLTISDSCSKKEATDESGPNLVRMLQNGIIESGKVLEVGVVPDSKEVIENMLKIWCDEKGYHVILTTGGTGLSKRDVTPEATMALSEKLVPGMSHLMFKQSLRATSFAALSRAVVGVRGNSLIINLPGSKKGSQECLEAVAEVIPHAVQLITNRAVEVKEVHAFLTTKKSSVSVKAVGSKIKPHQVNVSDAQKIISSKIYVLKREKVIKYDQARGHVLAEEIIAKDDLPPFDVSLMDGYAIVDDSTNKRYKIKGVSKIGDPVPEFKLLSGCCAKVSTGAAIPVGTTKVVQVEHATEDNGEMFVRTRDNSNTNIRLKGSDFEFGNKLLEYGTYLDAAALGILGAAGMTTVRVFDKPLVALMSTGNELVNPTDCLKPGKVRDSNRVTLMNLLMEENFKVVDLGIVPDVPDELRNSLELGFRKADVVVTSGNMSKGEEDFMKKILVYDFKAEIYFTEVFMKPGKPTAFGAVIFEGKPKLWFGLPGNPASAFVTSHLFLLPALRLISGIERAFPNCVEVSVNQPVPSDSRPQYLRAALTYSKKDNWVATVYDHQRSSSIRGCLNADCLVEVPLNFEQEKSASQAFNAWIIGKNLAFNCV